LMLEICFPLLEFAALARKSRLIPQSEIELFSMLCRCCLSYTVGLYNPLIALIK